MNQLDCRRGIMNNASTAAVTAPPRLRFSSRVQPQEHRSPRRACRTSKELQDVAGRHQEAILGARQRDRDPGGDERLTTEPRDGTAKDRCQLGKDRP